MSPSLSPIPTKSNTRETLHKHKMLAKCQMKWRKITYFSSKYSFRCIINLFFHFERKWTTQRCTVATNTSNSLGAVNIVHIHSMMQVFYVRYRYGCCSLNTRGRGCFVNVCLRRGVYGGPTFVCVETTAAAQRSHGELRESQWYIMGSWVTCTYVAQGWMVNVLDMNIQQRSVGKAPGHMTLRQCWHSAAVSRKFSHHGV